MTLMTGIMTIQMNWAQHTYTSWKLTLQTSTGRENGRIKEGRIRKTCFQPGAWIGLQGIKTQGTKVRKIPLLDFSPACNISAMTYS